MEASARDLLDLIHSCRAMRRLRPDPVPLGLLREVLAAGTAAPSGQNSQPWRFLVLRGDTAKAFFGVRYRAALESRFGEALTPPAHDHGPAARLARAAHHLALHMHEAPYIVLVCGRRDWPFAVPAAERRGPAPPSYGSVYPCVQNILLACRALGLGASLTTMHQVFEPELRAHFGVPDDHGIVAAIPIGYPRGRFGPVRRRPPEDVTAFDHWDATGFPAA